MSEYRYVRVVSDNDDDPNSPLLVDVLLGTDGQVKRGVPYAGWWGNFKSTSVWPFIAKQIDDTFMLDFGSDDETPQLDRYVLFNLLHGPIMRGKKFKLKWEGEWHAFTVRTLVDMIESQELE